MKNVRLIAALLAATIMASTVFAQEALKSAKEKSLINFNAVFGRFKRCIQLQCTKLEALKVARDVGVAAVSLIVAAYAAKGVITKSEEEIAKGVVMKSEEEIKESFPVGQPVSYLDLRTNGFNSGIVDGYHKILDSLCVKIKDLQGQFRGCFHPEHLAKQE